MVVLGVFPSTHWELMGESARARSPRAPGRALLLRLQCSLHIHASYSISQKLNVPMAPLSEPNAVGIVIAHGTEPHRGGWRGRESPYSRVCRVCVRVSPTHAVALSQGAWGGPSR